VNSLELREYNFEVIVLLSLLSSRCRSAIVVPVLKSILGKSPKVKDFIEDPFKQVTWLGGVHIGLCVRVQGTTTALRVYECYCFVTSFVF
jgi:hypothetical protein